MSISKCRFSLHYPLPIIIVAFEKLVLGKDWDILERIITTQKTILKVREPFRWSTKAKYNPITLETLFIANAQNQTKIEMVGEMFGLGPVLQEKAEQRLLEIQSEFASCVEILYLKFLKENKCVYCGADNKPDSVYCMNCREKIGLVCKCGEINKLNAKFCNKCGNAL